MNKLEIEFINPDWFRTSLRKIGFKSFIFQKNELVVFEEKNWRGVCCLKDDFKQGSVSRMEMAYITKNLKDVVACLKKKESGPIVIKYTI